MDLTAAKSIPSGRRCNLGKGVPVARFAQIEIFARHALKSLVHDDSVARGAFACMSVILLYDGKMSRYRT